MENKYIEIYEGNILNAYLLKCLLEKENIKIYRPEEIMNAFTMRSLGIANAGLYKVMVSPGDFDEALNITEAFKRTIE